MTDHYKEFYDRVFAGKNGLTKEEIVALNSQPEYHIPVFGGLGKTLCGILSYTLDGLRGQPLCKECERIEKEEKRGNKK